MKSRNLSLRGRITLLGMKLKPTRLKICAIGIAVACLDAQTLSAAQDTPYRAPKLAGQTWFNVKQSDVERVLNFKRRVTVQGPPILGRELGYQGADGFERLTRTIQELLKEPG